MKVSTHLVSFSFFLFQMALFLGQFSKTTVPASFSKTCLEQYSVYIFSMFDKQDLDCTYLHFLPCAVAKRALFFPYVTALSPKAKDTVATLEKPAALGFGNGPIFSQGIKSYCERGWKREIWRTSQPAVTLNPGFRTERTPRRGQAVFLNFTRAGMTSPLFFRYLIIIWRGQLRISPFRARTQTFRKHKFWAWMDIMVLLYGYHWIGTGCQNIPHTT